MSDSTKVRPIVRALQALGKLPSFLPTESDTDTMEDVYFPLIDRALKLDLTLDEIDILIDLLPSNGDDYSAYAYAMLDAIQSVPNWETLVINRVPNVYEVDNIWLLSLYQAAQESVNMKNPSDPL